MATFTAFARSLLSRRFRLTISSLIVAAASSVAARACPVPLDEGVKTVVGAATVFDGIALFPEAQLAHLDPEALTTMATDCQNRYHVTIVKLNILSTSNFASVQEARTAMLPGMPSEGGFDAWKECYLASKPKSIAQVLLIGSNLVVSRVISPSQGFKKSVIDRDHLITAETDRGGATPPAYRLLDFDVTESPKPDITFFVRDSNPVNLEKARTLATRLAGILKTKDVTLRVRSDDWFFTDAGFPTPYPFDALRVPLSKDKDHDQWQLKILEPPATTPTTGSVTCKGDGRCRLEPRP